MERMKEEESIMSSVRKFFGRSLVSADVDLMGRLANINIVYRDFVPMREVYAWAADSIPYLWSISVERTYSRKAYASVPRNPGLTGEEWQIFCEEWLLDKSFV